MQRAKLKQAAGILREQGIDLWLTFVRETTVTPDPVLDYIAGTPLTWETAILVRASGETLAIAGSLDIAGLQAQNAFDELRGYLTGIREPLLEALYRFDPQSIAINYSNNIPAADGLTHGLFCKLQSYLAETPFSKRLCSAEGIIAALRGRKSAEELQSMREAIDATMQGFAIAGEAIRPGASEADVAAHVTRYRRERGLEPAWDAGQCPAVFTGPDSAGAHAAPTTRRIEAGHLVNMDFGVKINGYCADLQRSWYVRCSGEREAPKAVQQGFAALLRAIDLAAQAMRPGVEGVKIDALARQHLVQSGYQEYPHGLGHQLGRVAHDGGALLAPAWERYGNTPFLPLEKGQIFTIEPRLIVAGYGTVTIEEEVLVTDDGVEFLSPRQNVLWLI